MIRLMAQLAPPRLAEHWDNVGLQLGDPSWPVKRVWVALDPLADVVAEACNQKVDMLITHHPLFFKPLKTIDCSTFEGMLILKALTHRLAIFSAHTNLDSAQGGINEVLCRRIGLIHLTVLRPANDRPELATAEGLGRVGDFLEPVPFQDFVERIKKSLNLSSIRYSGVTDSDISKVAICSGSGAGLMNEFLASGAQVYVSGDFKYHDARLAEAHGRLIVDIGHFPSEHIMVDVLAQRLTDLIEEQKLDLTVEACGLETDPFKMT
jgi:dinuclear metal center YbgI/SA1388 family protein